MERRFAGANNWNGSLRLPGRFATLKSLLVFKQASLDRNDA